jgi:predicted O-linked N-acetylglucosamine transferase (SPINDLY family)
MADPTVIPAGDCACYSEQVVWLPDSYQVNDSRRPISECTPTRQECGLPQTGFVFCCFNNVYKITPAIFGIWMRLLSATGNSVLWLFAPNSTAAANLRREAEQRGVSPERLVFADRADPADHLARHRHADLFLDTLPYNAHTTASDALWAGVPVLTCIGATFAGRVAASLLKAVGLDELITHSLRDYETLARKLAGDESRLAALKDRLVRHRTTYPLFDTGRFVRHIEAAYVTMWQRYQRGEVPAGYGESHPIQIL